MKKNIKALASQTLHDIALQEYGSIEALFDVIQDNNIESVNESVYPDDQFTIDANKVMVKPIVNMFIEKKVKPASASNDDSEIISGAFVTLEFTKDFDI